MLRLRELNPTISIEVYAERLTSENAMQLIQGHDIVLDGTDNIPTRYLINDVCEILGMPWVYGSIYRFEGQVSVFNLNDGPTYRDSSQHLHHLKLYPHVKMGESWGSSGVIGSIQATEAIKVLIQIGEPLRGKLLVYDALDMSMRTLTFSKIEREPVTELIDYEGFCGTKPMQMPFTEIGPTEYCQRRNEGWNPLFIDTRNTIEASIVSLPETDSLIPHEEILLADLPNDRDIVFYCRTGGRSAMAAYALSQTGFNPAKLYNLTVEFMLGTPRLTRTSRSTDS